MPMSFLYPHNIFVTSEGLIYKAFRIQRNEENDIDIVFIQTYIRNQCLDKRQHESYPNFFLENLTKSGKGRI